MRPDQHLCDTFQYQYPLVIPTLPWQVAPGCLLIV
jgi:hypothetical protein